MGKTKMASLKAAKFPVRVTKVRVEQRREVGDLASVSAVEFTTDGLSDFEDISKLLTASSMVPMPIVKP